MADSNDNLNDDWSQAPYNLPASGALVYSAPSNGHTAPLAASRHLPFTGGTPDQAEISLRRRSRSAYEMGQPRGGRAALVYAEKHYAEPKQLEELTCQIEADEAFLLGFVTLKALVEGSKIVVSNPTDDPRAEALASNLTKRLAEALPNIMKAYGRGRSAFEKVYMWNRSVGIYELDSLAYLEFCDTKIKLAADGQFDGVDLKVEGKDKIEIPANQSWWFAIDATPKNPHGASRYFPAPWEIFKERRATREHYNRWLRKLSLGIGALFAPSEYTTKTKNKDSGYTDTNMDGTPADPMEHGEMIVNALENGGYAILDSASYDQEHGGGKMWDLSIPENKIDAKPFAERLAALKDSGLESMGIPPRSITQNTDVGSNSMGQTHMEVLVATVCGVVVQIVSSWQRNVVEPAEAINARGGKRWGLTTTFQRPDPEAVAQAMEVVKSILTTPTPSPLVLHGVVDLPKLLEMSRMPIGDNVSARIAAVLKDSQQTQGGGGAGGNPFGGMGGAAPPGQPPQTAPPPPGAPQQLAIVSHSTPIRLADIDLDSDDAIPDARPWEEYANDATADARNDLNALIDLPFQRADSAAIATIIGNVRRRIRGAVASAKLAGAVAPFKPNVLGLPANDEPAPVQPDEIADRPPELRLGWSYVNTHGHTEYVSDATHLPHNATNVKQTRHADSAGEPGFLKAPAARGEMKSAVRQGKGKDAKLVYHDGTPVPDWIKPGMVAPTLTNVRLAVDPKSEVLVLGTKPNGQTYTGYSDQFHMRNAALKFSRVQEMLSKHEAIFAQNQQNRLGPNKEHADCTWLMDVQGTRPGGEADTKGLAKYYGRKMTADMVQVDAKGKVALVIDGKPIPVKDAGTAAQLKQRKESGGELHDSSYWLKSYGATTLESRHVVQGKDGVRLQFVGKEGVWHDHLVRDPELAKMLVARTKRNGKLFDTDYAKVTKYVKGLDGGHFSPKDLRTKRANLLALAAVQSVGRAKPFNDEKAYKAAVMEVAKKVSGVLGNRPPQALESYINPMVFAAWKPAPA
jgi:DNA topoisomerase IB